MATIQEKEWKTKFNEIPLLLKIVVLLVYIISIHNFLKFFFALIGQLRLDPFALAFGYLVWELAGGLVERSNLARIIALICFGFINIITVYILWNGGQVLLDGLDLSASYPSSIFWIVASGSSILILLLPQIRRLFSNSNKEKVAQ